MDHNCCKETKGKGGKKKGTDMFILWSIVATVLILGAVVFFGANIKATSQVAPDANVSASVEENKYDWGTIDINGGIVNKKFEIKNTGKSALKLNDVNTSCMCTTAQLKTKETVSKKFGMHEKSTDVFEVKPGETAELIIEFDPAFHGPSGVGPISRTITMNTNDAKNPQLSFYLTANVMKK